jgi:hypothetical protein
MPQRLIAIAVTAILLIAGLARAADAESRTFSVLVDGKPAGTHLLSYRCGDDGTETITSQTQVKVKKLLLSYTYSLSAVEVWKAGRLTGLRSKSNDNGKRAEVSVAATKTGLIVTGPDGRLAAPAGTITTTGWHKPPASATLLDAEDGGLTAVKAERLAAGRVFVNGKAVAAERYRITGDKVKCEWWFDAAGRPVRQEMNWDGHHVILELTACVRR